MGKDVLKRMNVAAALMGVEIPEEPVVSEVDRIVEEDRKLRERQAKLRKMKPWQRRKYERDRRRVRMAVYIPRPLSDLVNEISRHEITSPSSAASWLIAMGLKLWRENKAPSPTVVKSRNLRAENSLAIPPEWDGERVQRTFGLPALKEEIYAVAHRYKCGRSDATAWLMSIGASAYRAGTTPEREFSNDLRYTFRLRLPKWKSETSFSDGETSPGDVLKRYIKRD